MKIFDRIEEEADRLMTQEGKMMKAVYLGKKEWAEFLEELLDLQKTPPKSRAYARQELLTSAIVINDDVRVLESDNESELRVVPKERLFN